MDSLQNVEIMKRPTEYLYQLDWNDKFAVGTSRELLYSRTLPENYGFNPMSMMYCIDHPGNIHEYWLKILMQKEFPLLEKLNNFIQFATEAGLITKWIKARRSFVKKTTQIRTDYLGFNSFYV